MINIRLQLLGGRGASLGGGGNPKPLKATTVSKLEEMGGKYWQKGDRERVYLERAKKELAPAIGLELGYYNSGRISSAYLDGERISNADGNRISGVLGSIYVDVKTGVVHRGRYDYSSSYDEDTIKRVQEHINQLNR